MIFFIFSILALVVHMIVRIRCFRDLEQPKFFQLFWVWPLLWIGLFNLAPIWTTSFSWMIALQVVLALATLLDFVWYYALKTNTQKRSQMLSGLWLVPFLLFSFRHILPGGPELTLPHFERAIVWTDSLLAPKTFWFIAPETANPDRFNADQDPNFGKAAFSPLKGTFVGEESGFLRLVTEDESAEVLIGPIIPGSHKLEAGGEIFQNQPIGLVDKTSGKAPGLKLQVIRGGSPRFKDVVTGRYLAFRYGSVRLKRNQVAQSDSPTRFRLE